MSIQNTVLGTSATPIFTSLPNSGSIGPTGTSAVTTIHFCNTTTSPVTISIYVLPASIGTIGDDTMIYNSLQMAPKDTYIIDTEKLMLDAGDRIVAVASVATAITATVCYIGI
jgi:hypothetical protein